MAFQNKLAFQGQTDIPKKQNSKLVFKLVANIKKLFLHANPGFHILLEKSDNLVILIFPSGVRHLAELHSGCHTFACPQLAKLPPSYCLPRS